MKGFIISTLKMILLPLILILVVWVQPVSPQDTYTNNIVLKNMKFEWSIVNDVIKIKLTANTKGWVGVGFNPSKEMKDANIILGYVKKGKTKISDEFGISRRKHEKDTHKGGKNNITDISGNEKNGVTTIAFTIPLDSGDKRDSILGDKNTVLLAYGAGRDDFRSKHIFKTSFNVNLVTGQYSSVDHSKHDHSHHDHDH